MKKQLLNSFVISSAVEKSHLVRTLSKALIPSPSPPEASGEKGVSLLCDLS